MHNLIEKKQAFYKLAIETGMWAPEEIEKFLPFGSEFVERKTLEKWLRNLTSLPKKFDGGRRYVNRFKLGADPEFIFQSGLNGRVNASNLGLAQGPAFGSDNNGRLAEIRPYPSRSVVDVVASVLNTLRWMAVIKPKTLDYAWLSGAFLQEDGLGGHIHFGRKRPFRDREIRSLDAIEEGMLNLGVFPNEEVLRRRQGDAHRQFYGLPGDFRLQAHGYEYRTFPSWLDSPELAFLTIVVSKLAVQEPGLYAYKFEDKYTPEVAIKRLKNFLSYFKWVDDDARIALRLIDRGIPRHVGGDFKPRWGISRQIPAPVNLIKVLPLSIKPDELSKTEIFNYMLNGDRLIWRVPEITWGPISPPKNFRMCIDNCNTIQAKGLGEMVWDLCYHESLQVVIQGQREGTPIVFGKESEKYFPAGWQKMFKDVRYNSNRDYPAGHIVISQSWREGERIKKMKQILTSGLFPIWKVGDATGAKALEFFRRKSYKQEFNSQIVFESSDWKKLIRGEY